MIQYPYVVSGELAHHLLLFLMNEYMNGVRPH